MGYYGWSGKQKYEQLVEVKLSLEMEISTYRSILEDEEKRIKRCRATESWKQYFGNNGKNILTICVWYISNFCHFYRVSRKFSKSLANGGRGVAGDASSDSSSDSDNDNGYRYCADQNHDFCTTLLGLLANISLAVMILCKIFRSVDATDGRRNLKKSSYSYSSSNMR